MSRAGVASRPITQQSGGRLPVLPAIQHPMSGMAPGPAQIDVVGGMPPPSASGGRPLAAEQDYKIPKRLSTAGSRAGVEQCRASVSRRIEAIPEGVQVTEGDPLKTRMPIFGECCLNPVSFIAFADCLLQLPVSLILFLHFNSAGVV